MARHGEYRVPILERLARLFPPYVAGLAPHAISAMHSALVEIAAGLVERELDAPGGTHSQSSQAWWKERLEELFERCEELEYGDHPPSPAAACAVVVKSDEEAFQGICFTRG